MVQPLDQITFQLVDADVLNELENNSLDGMGHAIHLWAIEKEWRGPNAETQRTTGDDIALIHSEVSEALEAYREFAQPRLVWFTYDVEVEGQVFKEMTVDQLAVLLQTESSEELDDAIEELGLNPKPQGVGVELADALVRILDYCVEHEIDLQAMMKLVMDHNQTRAIRHGGKHL